MSGSTGFIEVDLFPDEFETTDHPEVMSFKALLEDVAEEHHCQLTSFEIDHGTVIFSFDSEDLTAKILRILEER